MQKNNEAFLIFPHQLYKDIFKLSTDKSFFIVEDPLYFGDKKYNFNFHKKKLMLHRASMKYFYDSLIDKGFDVHYIEYKEIIEYKNLFEILHKQHVSKVNIYDPTDFVLEKRLQNMSKEYKIELSILESPNFITSLELIKKFFEGKKHFSMNNFYIYQRKRLNILTVQDKPLNGRWSYDTENRKKLPRNISELSKPIFNYGNYINEAKKYAMANFSSNIGDDNDFDFPINHQQAKELLDDFLKNKIDNFGPFEDAISENQNVLFHSYISSSLNIGLLSPEEIVEEVLKKYKKENIASIEGFIRQIIGWREFMRAVYVLKGVDIRNSNFLKHTNKIYKNWYTGNTGIYPLDITIKKVLKSAYCHHIERLMILGNVMLLTEIDPNDAYKWFMEMFIDAYDWVMVPNVYSMSQFADGGLITTKPYFSSSNYVLKMSDYKKGEWCKVWDALFYNFIDKNRNLIAKNPRLSLLIRNLDKKSKEQIKDIKDISDKYIGK